MLRSWCVWKREQPEKGGGGILSSHPLLPQSREKNPCYFLGITVSIGVTADQSEHWVHVISGAREGLLRLMVGVGRAAFTWAKGRLSCIHGCCGSLCYLHWFMRLLHSRSIADYRSTSARVDWCEKTSLGLVSVPNLPPGRKGECRQTQRLAGLPL